MEKLTGSEKQIEWATEIRDYTVPAINKLVKLGMIRDLENAAELAEEMAEQTSAKFWIDLRNLGHEEKLRDFAVQKAANFDPEKIEIGREQEKCRAMKSLN